MEVKKMKNSMRWFTLVLAVGVLFSSAALAAGDEPSGTVSIETKSVAIGIGFSWGEGVLNYKGKEYKFKVKGLSVVDVGVTSVSATGHVYHLDKIEDFTGTYTAAEAGIAIGGGVGAQAMENQNGVVMQLTSTKTGIKVKLAPEGLEVKME
jgi:hypothetical protein